MSDGIDAKKHDDNERMRRILFTLPFILIVRFLCYIADSR